jgi:hypothetical protein
MNFNKEVSLGNVLTILALIGTITVGYAKLETRLSLLEASEQIRVLQGREIKQDMRELRTDMKTLIATILKEQIPK